MTSERDPARIRPLLDAAEAAWLAGGTDLRFTQLLWAAVRPAGNDHGIFYNFEDDVLLDRLKEIADGR